VRARFAHEVSAAVVERHMPQRIVAYLALVGAESEGKSSDVSSDVNSGASAKKAARAALQHAVTRLRTGYEQRAADEATTQEVVALSFNIYSMLHAVPKSISFSASG
jgi:hypothetical protein